jgi:hypothetical protein
MHTPVRFLSILCVSASASWAQTTYFVAPCGNDAWSALEDDCQAPNGPKRTIQAAIDASADGDTVLLADGVYTGTGNRDLDFGGRAITLRSKSGPDACIIDCGGSKGNHHRAFTFHSGETGASVLKGITVRNGYMSRGGAVLCEAGSSPNFRQCVFTQNIADTATPGDGGGAVYNLDSSPAFEGCQFVRNQTVTNVGQTGGGAMLNGGSGPTLTDCVFLDNSSFGPHPASGGGALANAFASDPILVGCTFTGNSTTSDGGAILNAEQAHPQLTSCTFTGNTAVRYGGGMINIFDSRVALDRCVFVENSAELASAVYVETSTGSTIKGCTFTGNVGGYIGAVLLARSVNTVIDDCEFTNNIAATTPPDPSAGALQIDLSSGTLVSRCRFTNNTSSFGGAVLVAFGTDTLMVNCAFAGNTSVDRGIGASGGAICDFASTGTRIVNSSFAKNSSQDSGGAIGAFGGSEVVIENCAMYGNSAPVGAEICAGLQYLGFSESVRIGISYSTVQGGEPGIHLEPPSTLDWSDGALDADPLFADAAGGDLSLAAGSPAIDAGFNASVPPDTADLDGDGDTAEPTPLDLSGLARFVGDGPLPIVDMGAYEFRHCYADFNADGGLDLFDFLAFVNLFNTADPAADCDQSGGLDLFDFLCFANSFNAGC